MPEHQTFAIEIAKTAGNIIRENFSLGMKKEWKADQSPVTATDLAINRLIIEEIMNRFPGHGIIGEEESLHSNQEYLWICDPVDGTIPFSHGRPTFVFSLALTHHGKSILGVIYDPILDRLVYAEKGKGAQMNGKPIHVSEQAVLDHTCCMDLDFFDERIHQMLVKLVEKDCMVSSLHTSTYTSMLVALGEHVAQIYPHDKCWDGAAVKIVVEEAGGTVTDLNGEDQRYDRPINGYIASNGHLHQELLALWRDTQMSER